MKRLILALLLTACALAQIPENPTGPNPAGGGVGGASTLTGSNALLKDAAAGTAGVSVLFDSGAFFGNTAARTIGWGIYNRTGNISPGTTRYALWNGSLVVGDPATLGSESLTDGTFTIPTWTRTGDFTVNTGAAVYTHSAGSGTFTQLNASMAIALAGGKWYSLVGDIATTGTAPACILTSATADTSGGLLAGLRTAAGTTVELLQFKAAAVPTGFVGSCTSTVAGTVAYDNLVLKEVVGGDLMLSGSLYARGATFYGGSGSTNVSIQRGRTQVGNAFELKNATGTAIVYFDNINDILSSVAYWVGNSAGGIWTSAGLKMPMAAGLYFSSTASAAGVLDSSALRTSVGRLQIAGVGVGKWGTLDASNFYANALATPGAVTSIPTCAGTCATTYTYTVSAKAADQVATTIPGAANSNVTDQAATLDGTHYNTLSATAVSGASYYTFRRTVGGATQGALASCTNIATPACVDNGLVGDGSAAPTANTTGFINGKYKSGDGTVGFTGTACTAFKDGLCVSGT